MKTIYLSLFPSYMYTHSKTAIFPASETPERIVQLNDGYVLFLSIYRVPEAPINRFSMETNTQHTLAQCTAQKPPFPTSAN